MTTQVTHGRQYVLVAMQDFTYADLVDGSASAVTVLLPDGAVVLRGALFVDTVSNAAGTGTIAIADGTTTYLAATTSKTAGGTVFTAKPGVKADGDITITSAANTGATAGAFRLIVEYIITDRAMEVQPN